MKQVSIILLSLLFFSCNQSAEIADNQQGEAKEDSTNLNYKVTNHSYSNIEEINTTHLNLELEIDFDAQVIHGVARHKMKNNGTKRAIFDINRIEIKKVTTGSKGHETEVTFDIGISDSILGSPLIVNIEQDDSLINIYYNTAKNADALDWLAPNLTGDKKYPFLYTQGEAILTRSWIPTQDTPENRFTYSANVKVPKELLAVMSANNPEEKNETGEYSFEMGQPIPSYLMALAVGELEFARLGEVSGVYAEPYMIDAAKEELKDIPKMIDAAEELYGKYRWEEYDVLILPYSFPYGGMENPRLTFATPTIIAGDGSLVTLIAHELAHSWSGNLVTMASWNDFWLNEGFTMYIENRIMEKIDGRETADMLALINFQDLHQTLNQLQKNDRAEDTRLKLDLEGRNPDEGMTDIAYDKGFFFLKTLEQKVGRKKFDLFLRSYFDHYQFQSITTEDFVQYLKTNLLEKENIDFNVDEWIYGEGIPDNIVKLESDRFKIVEELAKNVKENGLLPEDLKRSDKTTQEWRAFIRAFDGKLSKEKMKKIDQQLHFKDCGNSEIEAEWYVLAIQNDYTELHPLIKDFLLKVGRMKFLEAIYEALADHSEKSSEWGKEIFKEARPNYHPLSRKSVDKIFTVNK